MKTPIKYKSIKVRASVYKDLKREAITHDCSMLELIERMVAYIPHLKEGALNSYGAVRDGQAKTMVEEAWK